MSEALQKALRLLAMREHSALELTQKLMRSGYAETEVEHALAYCQQHGYQDNERFLAQFCRVRVEQGQGPLKIIYALKQHGFSQGEVEQLFAALQVDWVQLASKVLQKHGWRFKASDVLSKSTRFLLARGFPVDVIRLSLKERSMYEDR